MKILLIGQCTLHWGRMEFGNIGNFYIAEPLIRGIHAQFPNATIRTTLQFSKDFCLQERIETLPMNLYYGWDGEDNLATAQLERELAEIYAKTAKLDRTTPFIDEVRSADLVIDFSGDIWGDNANTLGPDRFRVGLLKDRTAQLLGKPVVMLAGSPGPFGDAATRDLARKVYADFALVTNREPISTRLLEEAGFDLSRTMNTACPAFAFEPAPRHEVDVLVSKEDAFKNTPLVGMILCGWNMSIGPFSRQPREDEEFVVFAEAMEQFLKINDAHLLLLSHNHAFVPPPDFKTYQGRDYAIVSQLQRIIIDRGNVEPNRVHLLESLYQAKALKGLIGRLDMLISGRVHGAVAGLSQGVPTVLIDYGHEPKAHKLRGFAEVAGVEDLIVDPSSSSSLCETTNYCWQHRREIREGLFDRIPTVTAQIRDGFAAIASALETHNQRET